MKNRFTIESIKNSRVGELNKHLFEETKSGKTKYGNKKTEVEGMKFDSKKEAKRYKELRLLLKSGEIGFLARQVQYELNEGGSHSLIYIADFQYTTKEGELIVEDVKGVLTREFKKKRMLMKKIHGIDIKII